MSCQKVTGSEINIIRNNMVNVKKNLHLFDILENHLLLQNNELREVIVEEDHVFPNSIFLNIKYDWHESNSSVDKYYLIFEVLYDNDDYFYIYFYNFTFNYAYKCDQLDNLLSVIDSLINYYDSHSENAYQEIIKAIDNDVLTEKIVQGEQGYYFGYNSYLMGDRRILIMRLNWRNYVVYDYVSRTNLKLSWYKKRKIYRKLLNWKLEIKITF